MFFLLFLIYFYIFLPFQSALTFITIFPCYRFLSVLLCRWNNGTTPISTSDSFDCFIHLLIDTSTKCPIIFWLYETLRLSQEIILSTFRIWFSPTVDIIFSYYRFRSVALNLPNKKTANRLWCITMEYTWYIWFTAYLNQKTIHILFN